jgi:hypothetical protein
MSAETIAAGYSEERLVSQNDFNSKILRLSFCRYHQFQVMLKSSILQDLQASPLSVFKILENFHLKFSALMLNFINWVSEVIALWISFHAAKAKRLKADEAKFHSFYWTSLSLSLSAKNQIEFVATALEHSDDLYSDKTEFAYNGNSLKAITLMKGKKTQTTENF